MATRHSFLLGLFASLALAQSSTLDCTPSSTSGLQPDCWAQLKVSEYIKDWLDANGTAADCDNLGFAQCFLQYNGYSGRTCNLLSRGTCDSFETTGSEATYYSSQQFYTLWNIYAMYQFFNQFSEALSNGVSLAGATIDDIVATVSPSTDASSPSTLLWTAISGGFWMLAATPLGPFAALVNTGLAVVTGMSSFFMSSISGSSTARFVLLGDIGSELATLVTEYQTSLENALKELQNNSTLFIAAAEPGGFSTRAVTSLNTQSVDIFHDLQLYILSEALKGNNIVSARSTDTIAMDVATNTGAVDCPSLSAAGNCYQFWVDEEAGNTYALHSTNDWGFDDSTDVLNKIVDSGWANLSEIFKVEDCQGKEPGFDGTKVSCLATHKYCEWDYASQVSGGKWTQWTNCDADSKWDTQCSSWSTIYLIPDSYLGPALADDTLYCRKL
ncbi:hypothetical protein J7T55_009206 [Diaporthe amygdali]|uniref:uncharacterized protein n=1 Tax=Phomopsis amygdali TaxID=1214568 RepID=UPI0022FF448C|nr:uncharacterized protein J7T55_009206 [Diaporthe amygdali]KAJ0118423.1 hypothetical protein J7T55_009206 [Diaporthe amygdali]